MNWRADRKNCTGKTKNAHLLMTESLSSEVVFTYKQPHFYELIKSKKFSKLCKVQFDLNFVYYVRSRLCVCNL